MKWWKGNLHTHSFWSDGDDYPEMIYDWYKTNGYNFLALSDHNVFQEGKKWITVSTNNSGIAAFEKYLRRFGEKWVTLKYENGRVMVKLKTYAEFNPLFEEPGQFLMIPSEEITCALDKLPIHLNGTNVKYLIKPKKGNTVLEVLQKNVNSVLDQRADTGQLMFPHINHPNFGWALNAEDIMQVKGERFFEVYNGHPSVHNEGDATRVDVEHMWDIILTMRLSQLGLEVIYGLATDDAHNYHTLEVGKSNSGRGWVMVHAATLSITNIITSMEAGEFYASSGVRLKEITQTKSQYRVVIDVETGVNYTTAFYGTRKKWDTNSVPVLSAKGEVLDVTRRYSGDVGEKFAEIEGSQATYKLKGDEIYVRATVTSTKLKSNPYIKGEFEKAWAQPFVLKKKR